MLPGTPNDRPRPLHITVLFFGRSEVQDMKGSISSLLLKLVLTHFLIVSHNPAFYFIVYNFLCYFSQPSVIIF